MYADEHELKRKKNQTAAIVCIVSAVMIIFPLFMPKWLKGRVMGVDVRVSLFTFEMCGNDRDWETGKTSRRCESMSNGEFIDQAKAGGDKNASSVFPPLGWVTLVTGLISGLALLAAGVLGLKGRFIREPIALTTVGLAGSFLALVAACVWIAVKPGYIPKLGPILGLSWPFFVYGTGVVAGISGAMMLAKANSDVRDPYWDGLAPEPGEPGVPGGPGAGNPPTT